VSAPRRFAPAPFEVFTWSATAATVVFLRAQGLRIDWRTVEFMAVPMLSRLPSMLLWGLALQGVALAVRRRSPASWLREVATPGSAALWLRVWLAAMAMTYSYTWLKVCVPLLRRELLDAPLLALDRIVHFGLSPSVFAAELVRGTVLAGLLDRWYGLWVTSVLATLAFVFLSPRPADRRHFALACALLWIVGSWLYLALPAVGPCYANPELFAGLREEIPGAVAAQNELWRNYARVVAGRDGSLRQFKPYLGVAAMPSLHVGAHWLFALWARRRAPRLFVPFALATALTFLASVATGWHYAIDGYAGLLLAWAAVRVADRCEPPAAPAESGGAPAGEPPAAAAS
jgi:hypothetical protein